MSRIALRLFAALASGAVLAVISPPLNLHWLHWVSFLPLFWALRPGEEKRNALLGYAAGWIGVFLLFFWLIETVVRVSSLPWLVALLIHVLFASLFALPYALVFGPVHWLRKRIGVAWTLIIPCLQVMVEKLSPALFPYYHGVSQYRTEWTWQLASVLGVYGLTWLIFFSNSVVAETLYRHREGRRPPWAMAGLLLALLGANLGFGAWRHASVEEALSKAPVVRVALLQQGVTMEQRLNESALKWLTSWMNLTRKAAKQRPDLVVWPEGAVPFNPHDEQPAHALGDRSPRQYFEQLAHDGGFDLLVGGGTYEEHPVDAHGSDHTAFNSCYLFDDQKGLNGRYDKMVPLPFGEYIPLSETFPFLKHIIDGPGDFQAGDHPTQFKVETRAGRAWTFTTPICYEAILESAMRELADTDVFVNITNDAWFGDTAAPHQHAMLAAVQAMQLGRPMLRIAYTGIDFVVEPHGAILYESTPFTEQYRVEELRMARFDTVYMRMGWIFPWICIFAVLGAFGFAWRRRPAA